MIVVVPAFPHLRAGNGEIIYRFNLAGGAGVMTTAAADTVYPETITSVALAGRSSGAVKEPVELTPGETKVLVNSTARFRSKRDTPVQEEETLRYVLKITALKDGRLPKRNDKARQQAPDVRADVRDEIRKVDPEASSMKQAAKTTPDGQP